MYEMILFDVDGVLLSEKRCFDTTCLTVWELLHSPRALGLPGADFDPAPDEETIDKVRKKVFNDEQILEWLKSRGVNSNWDMAALLFGYQLQELLKALNKKEPEFVAAVLRKPLNRDALVRIGEMVREVKPDFVPRYGELTERLDHTSVDRVDLLGQVNRLAEEWSGIPTRVFAHGSGLWNLTRDTYQEWYLGREWFEKQEKKAPIHPEKRGFLEQEIPLADPAKIRSMLEELNRRGIVLGIGTGRPELETHVPLKTLGLMDAFDTNRIVTASDVERAEEVYPNHAPLGKPHPYTYVKAFFGRETSDTKSVAARLPLPRGKRVLIVGDSVADLLAARRMGCSFAATLTGPSGTKARGKFEEMEAEHILENVTGLLPLIERLEEEQKAAEEAGQTD
ncbi:phosphoglycolate phosphatase-like HAD superfamily hydrolase [Melghirimyces profundicolus]|uniref:Phosphoglycolate phosphatase-like HAD superfamily hydrolase n=1 Tax=Melghirimyces profundicolus TaxID=1242148 RepID=A0A2T6BCB1_9BACL|nr:HAD family hydrolase [Melghirimyces profundicolus]PTX53656.1 phosphoglycolate phosphatase-like HAD superfamily hydrolase [Melghirimyces profundicolus]